MSKTHLKTLKVIGSVGEPINEEAWHWYNDHVGQKMSVVDTWWQTNWRNHDLNCICNPTKPTYATLPLPGIQPVLMDENREIEGNQVVGSLCIKFPWPGIARTDHQRYKDI
jgi:acetyl-CoA synthetase